MKDTREEEQIYDAWLLWNIYNGCNLSCEYCCSTAPKAESPAAPKTVKTILEDIKRNIGKISGLPISELAAIISGRISRRRKPPFMIDIPALMKALEATGKTFRITFSGGGEPFLVGNIIETCQELTRKHYISFNTNLTTKNIREFCDRIDPKRVVNIDASLHIKELERRNLVDEFIRNFLLCKKRGFCMYATEVAYPKLFNEIGKYKKFFLGKGIELIFVRFRGKYQGKEYPASYTSRELKAFGIKDSANLKMAYSSKCTICNAGYNTAIVLSNGDIVLCGDVKEPMGNIYGDIRFKKDMIRCPVNSCSCPLCVYDPYLFEKAMGETGGKTSV